MERVDPAQIHPAILLLVKMLAALGASRVLFYGSRARGDNHDRADIDLAVDAPELDRMTWMAMQGAAEGVPTLLKTDLVHLQKIDGSFKDNVLRDGKLLYDTTG